MRSLALAPALALTLSLWGGVTLAAPPASGGPVKTFVAPPAPAPAPAPAPSNSAGGAPSSAARPSGLSSPQPGAPAATLTPRGAQAAAGHDQGEPEAAEDIRPPRPPLPIPPGPPWGLIAGLALAALAAGLGLRWLINQHREAQPSPYALALARLEHARALIGGPEESAEPFAVAVSDTLRTWLQDELGLPAGRRTTDEFLRDLAEAPSSPVAPDRALLERLLERLDLAKFAGWRLEVEAMEGILDAARRFVVAVHARAEAARLEAERDAKGHRRGPRGRRHPRAEGDEHDAPAERRLIPAIDIPGGAA